MTQSPMTYGFNCYGELVEQDAPKPGQGFLTPNRKIVFFEQWDDESGFAVCYPLNGKAECYYYGDLRWLPEHNLYKKD